MHLVCMGCQHRKLKTDKSRDIQCGLTNAPPHFIEQCSNFVFYDSHHTVKKKVGRLKWLKKYWY